MSYSSPIEIVDRMTSQLEEDVMKVILSYDINVDKEELIKALQYDREQYRKGYEDALAELEQEKGKWIPVTETLPQNYEQAICIDGMGKMMIGTYGEYGWTFPCYMTEPVAWMPLPEPYKEGK